MFRSFFSQLFDAPAETVIAQGRAVLAALSLLGVFLGPGGELNRVVQLTLILYAFYALAILAALHWRLLNNAPGAAVHSIDIGVVVLLLFLTDGFSSPFFLLFTFVLTAASLRWDWEGIAATVGSVAVIAIIVAAVDVLEKKQSFDLHHNIIRAAYIVAAGTLLAYASAHREHESDRLKRLSQWPSALGHDQTSTIADLLRHAAAVLEADRALVVWRDDTSEIKSALWENGLCHRSDDVPAAVHLGVVPELAHLSFSRSLPHLDRINTARGATRVLPTSIPTDFASRFQILDCSSAPFSGITAQGRLFILGNIRASDQHLLITQIIADCIAAALDRIVLFERAAAGAAARERAKFTRDLHDGLLQTLTGVRTQLELVSGEHEQASSRLHTARELLLAEQRRIRRFVEETRDEESKFVPLRALRENVEEAALCWGCNLSLVLSPEGALISRKALNDASLMLAEAIANSVRHGSAREVQATVKRASKQLEMDVCDDGTGYDQFSLDEDRVVPDEHLPRSLKERVAELGGSLAGWSSHSGLKLHFEIPIS